MMAIAHGHCPSVIPFGLVATPMRATYHNAAFLAAGVPVFDIRDTFGATDIVISSSEKGVALAEALGDKSVVLLRAQWRRGRRTEPSTGRCSAPSHRDQRARPVAGGSARGTDRGARCGRRPQGRRVNSRPSPIVGALEKAREVMKQQLVDAIRMLERAAIIDHNGHCSARRDASSFYINSGASVRGALTVNDIVTVDLDGNLVEGSARPPLEFHIHSEVYRARPDVNAVMHTHPQWSTFLTMAGVKFKPVYAQGVLLGDIPLMDSPLSVNTKPMGEKLAATLGRGPAALLKARLRHRRSRHHRMLRACRICRGKRIRQYMAMQIGNRTSSAKRSSRPAAEKLWSPSLFKKTWDHYYSKLGDRPIEIRGSKRAAKTAIIHPIYGSSRNVGPTGRSQHGTVHR